MNTVYNYERKKNVYKSWKYFLFFIFGTKKRFRNARHKCALKPCTDLKSRNMIAFSNIICISDASSKLFSVSLRGYTYKQIFVHNSCNSYLAQKDLEMRVTNVHQTLALIWSQEIRLLSQMKICVYEGSKKLFFLWRAFTLVIQAIEVVHCTFWRKYFLKGHVAAQCTSFYFSFFFDAQLQNLKNLKVSFLTLKWKLCLSLF